jgi:hypothetical protein
MRARAREADDGGKSKNPGMPGRQARRSVAPRAPGAERMQGHSFFMRAMIRASSVIGPPSGPAW